MSLASPARRWSWVVALVAGGVLPLWLAAAPAVAKDGPVQVDVELVLAVDISYSMDQDEQRLQRGGYIAAVTSHDFIDALRSGPTGKIAVAYMEWASAQDQKVLIDWTVIDGEATARAFADKLMEAPYRRASRTSISGAIDFAMQMFVRNGFNGARRVIDVSGDGPNNNGRPVVAAREAAVADGVTVNGLPLLIRQTRFGYVDIENLDEYYADCVIGGEGAFMIPVNDTKAFVEATRTKLVREVAMRAPRRLVVPVQATAPRVSCMIGENLWQQRMGN
jgi:hypothetical protein